MTRHCFEATFASSVRIMRNLSGFPLNPLQVTFIYPKSETTVEYLRVFGCPVLFNQRHNLVTIDPAFGRISVRIASPVLLQQLEDYAQRFLAQMEPKPSTIHKVTKIILARQDEEGVAFSHLLQEIRKRLPRAVPA